MQRSCFKVTLYGPGDTSQSICADAVFLDASIVFKAEGEEICTVPLILASVEKGGFENQELLINGKTEDDKPVVCYIKSEEKNIFIEACKAHWNETNRPKILRVLNVAKNSGKKHKCKLMAFVLGCILFFICCYYGIRLSSDFISSKIPEDFDSEIGKVAAISVIDKRPLIKRGPVYEEINAMLQKVASGIENSKCKFKLYLVDDDSVVNAMAAPGGHVLVFTGIIKDIKDPDELAGILAHECSHVTKRHGIKRLANQAIGTMLIYLIFSGEGSSNLAAYAGSQLLTQAYSRDDEREADCEGVKLLHKVGIDPTKFPNFFARLEKDSNKSLDTALSILSTHPMHSERIKYINELYKTLPKKEYKPSSQKWDEIRELINK